MSVSVVPPVIGGINGQEEVERSVDRQSDGEDEDGLIRSMARRRKKPDQPSDALHVCRDCKKEFKRPCDLTKHEKSHSRPWKCTHKGCKYSEYGWPTEKERDRHINDKHSTTVPTYKCHYQPCTYESKRESNCKQHMEKAHGWEYVRSKSNGKKTRSSYDGDSHSSRTLTGLTPFMATPSTAFASPAETLNFQTPLQLSAFDIPVESSPVTGVPLSPYLEIDFSAFPSGIFQPESEDFHLFDSSMVPSSDLFSGAPETASIRVSAPDVSSSAQPDFSMDFTAFDFEGAVASGPVSGGLSHGLQTPSDPSAKAECAPGAEVVEGSPDQGKEATKEDSNDSASSTKDKVALRGDLPGDLPVELVRQDNGASVPLKPSEGETQEESSFTLQPGPTTNERESGEELESTTSSDIVAEDIETRKKRQRSSAPEERPTKRQRKPQLKRDKRRLMSCIFRKHQPDTYNFSNSKFKTCHTTSHEYISTLIRHLERYHDAVLCHVCLASFSSRNEGNAHKEASACASASGSQEDKWHKLYDRLCGDGVLHDPVFGSACDSNAPTPCTQGGSQTTGESPASSAVSVRSKTPQQLETPPQTPSKLSSCSSCTLEDNERRTLERLREENGKLLRENNALLRRLLRWESVYGTDLLAETSE